MSQILCVCIWLVVARCRHTWQVTIITLTFRFVRSTVYSDSFMENGTVLKAGGRGSRRLLFDAMPGLLYSGDTELHVSASFTHLYLPPQVCLYPQFIFISAAKSIYLNLERREKCYMCTSVYRVVYFFQRTGGSITTFMHFAGLWENNPAHFNSFLIPQISTSEWYAIV